MKIEPGDIIVVVLQNPREKVLGVLSEITPAGLSIRGIDLNYFEDWIAAINGNEPYLPMQDSFFPMWRIERMTRDESTEGMKSMSDQFQQRTGRQIGEF
jgi:hypothetical protein